MGSRRERIEVVLSGGRPWGFSIKGGRESNKPLVVSKLEKGGKAECGGLFVGDVVYSINNVPLSGMRSDAIQFVKQSGHLLVLEVERGVHPSKPSYHHSATRQFPNQQYYQTASQPQLPQASQQMQHPADLYDDYERGDPYERPSGREDDVFGDDSTKEIPELNRSAQPLGGVRDRGDFSSGMRDSGVSSDYQSSRSSEAAMKDIAEPPSQPFVKLRERKNR
uniref:Protein Shroom2-like n=1 Tax=Phallusia mammillata TaxID=59560 RepID=A0A6F9DSS9_9ASCI|nr:protein Shroom2-like [Phallusia mammillata]